MGTKRLTGYGKNATNFYDLARELRNYSEWSMGSMRGTTQFDGYGQLSVVAHESVSKATYIVYSYDTPIAWHSRRQGWVMPDVKYSNTTTRHQGRIRTALQFV